MAHRPGLALLGLLLLLGLPLLAGWLREVPVPPSPRPSPRPGEGEVGGVVLAEGLPVTGAVVRCKGTARVTHSNAAGRFRLRAQPGERLTAWREGFFIAGARAASGPLRLTLSPLPTDDNPDYEWVDPSPDPEREHACANCHAAIYREWAASGHARSASGQRFRNLYEGTNAEGKAGVGWGLLEEHPGGAGVCASCHAPGMNEDALPDMRAVRGVDRQGVHCDYCHKINGPGDGKIGLTFGKFNLQLLRPSQGQLFFGPLDDVDRGEDAFSPFYRESGYCASCHEGIVFGVHVYSTWSEWLASPARRQGQNCQHCHMAPTGRMTNIAPGHGGIERDPKTLANHRFFRPTRLAMLRQSLRLDTRAESSTQGGDNVVKMHVRLRAEGVGHRVPTGFIDRHLVLVVEGLWPDGKPIPVRAGPRLPRSAGPELAGRAGRVFAKHLHDEKGQSPVPFWRADPEFEDNRLTPGHVEELVWHFPPEVRRFRIRVLYRRFWIEVGRAKGWPDEDQVVVDRDVVVDR